MKLEDKKKIVVQIYPGRKFGTVIGSNDGLIGILQDNGEYIDVPQERLRIISEEVERWKRQELYQITRNVCVVENHILLTQIRKGVLVSRQGGCS